MLGTALLRRRVKNIIKKTPHLCRFWLDLDQSRATEKYPCYRDVVEENCQLLDLTLHDLAKKAHISIWAIRFFARFPDLIPRPDYLERLCEALLLPVDYLKNRGSYGAYAIKRLLYYHYKIENVSELIAKAPIQTASQEQLDEMVAMVEALRWEELDRREGRVP